MDTYSQRDEDLIQEFSRISGFINASNIMLYWQQLERQSDVTVTSLLPAIRVQGMRDSARQFVAGMQLWVDVLCDENLEDAGENRAPLLQLRTAFQRRIRMIELTAARHARTSGS